jgi:thiopurine S-methyltransferase
MDAQFWHNRWKEGRIAFHEGHANTLFERHVGALDGCERVLVPLCGKAEDLSLLAARGHQVVGIELVEQAARAFFSEHSLEPNVRTRGSLLALSSGAIEIVVGDFFAAPNSGLGSFDAFYDRAAMIALPQQMRGRYVSTLRSMIQKGAPGIVITLEYPQSQMEGPPFAVLEDELRQHYEGAEVKLLEDRAATGGRLASAGIPGRERSFLIKL